MLMKSKIRFAVIIVFAFLYSALPVYAADLTVSVNAGAPIRTIPMTLYGANLASWDWHMDGSHPEYTNLLKASGCKYLRVPGGSWGNGVLWSDIEGPNGSQGWKVSYADYLNLMSLISQPGEEVHPTLQPIVNFPGWWYDTLQDNHPGDDVCDYPSAHVNAVHAAAGWVQDQSSRPVCAEYWEIGNEIGGPWEVGYFPTISGTFYGNYFADFVLSMKAVNPNIKIGACAEPTNDLNPYGWYQGRWDHDTLVAAKAKNVVPDFFIIHSYQNGGGDGGASNNPTLLGSQVDQIAQWTSNMNSIVQNTLGAQYVGQIGYYMTEWNTSATDTYDRPSCYVNAMFRAQYILEMAKNNWIGSNPWIYDYNDNFVAYPAWYVNPMLINKFGRNMVATSSNNSTVRAYSSIDANDNLTMFIVNNSSTTDLTAQINISGMTIDSGGQEWIMQPAGDMISGGLTIQDYNKISINGIVNPDPLTVNSLAPQTFTSGSSFTISIPKSCMILLRMPSTGVDTIAPASPTGLTASPVTGGIVTLDWNDNTEGDLAGYNVYRSTTSGSGFIKQNNLPVTGSNYTDYHAVTSQTYYYVVRAADTFWNESGNSNEVSIMLVDTTPPAAPSRVSATAGDTVVSLDWDDNIEPDVNGYNVYRSYVSGGPYTRQNGRPLSSSDFNDANVTNGTIYYYVVTAVDTSLHESLNSSQVSARPQLNPIVGILGSWTTGTTHTKETGANRALILVAHAKGSSSSSSLTAVTYGGNAMTKIIDKLTGSSSSRAYVAAFILNDANIKAATTTTFTPTWTSAPSNITYSSVFLKNVNQTTLVGATASAGTTGSTTVSTSALANSSGDMAIESAASSVAGTYTVTTGWTEGLDLSVTGYDGMGGYEATTGTSVTPSVTQSSGNHSLIGFVVKIAPNVAPAAPTGLSATSGIGIVILNWNDNTEADFNGYNIYRSTTSGSGYVKLNSSLLSSPDYTDTNVVNGTTYYYVVTAVDTGGLESIYSGEVSSTPSNPASGTGSLLREWWLNIPGDQPGDLTTNVNYPDNPSGGQLLTKLEGPINWDDNYGSRIHGYLNPVTTGDYTFWIASSDLSDLYLSTDTNPSNVEWIANVEGSTDPCEWNKYESQQSYPVSLVAGQKYYIMVIYKASAGNDNIAVAWEGPGISRQIIDGLYLSPCGLKFLEFAGFAGNWSRTDCGIGNDWCSGTDFDRNGTVDIDDLATFVDGWLAGI